MPIYEYYCDGCRRTSSFLILKKTDEDEIRCTRCQSKDVRRVLSRVAILRSEDKRFENLLQSDAVGGLDEHDPRSVERLMKRMGSELGDELGEGFEEEMEEALASSDETDSFEEE